MTVAVIEDLAPLVIMPTSDQAGSWKPITSPLELISQDTLDQSPISLRYGPWRTRALFLHILASFRSPHFCYHSMLDQPLPEQMTCFRSPRSALIVNFRSLWSIPAEPAVGWIAGYSCRWQATTVRLPRWRKDR